MDIQADFSCHIRLNNKTNVLFQMTSAPVKHGEWPDGQGQPPNEVEADKHVDIILKDKAGPGAEGSITYEFKLKTNPDTNINFTLNFKCPAFSDNFLGASTNHPELISINVHKYNEDGHPFYGEVDIFALGSKPFNSVEGEKATSEIDKATKAYVEAVEDQDTNFEDFAAVEKRPFHANFSIGFKAEGLIPINKDPVHENIAIAAFIKTEQLPEGVTYNNLNLKQWEHFRGLLWNDDPSCLLFKDTKDNNHDWAAGLEWYDQFKNGPPNCMTKRSHFGDLQLLHGMASKNGEAAEDTKRNILTWMEVLYKLACGNQGVAMEDKLNGVLPAHFNGSTKPPGDATMKQLLMGTTPKFLFPNVQRRALGVCLHIIQDSYAIGHAQRCLLNPEDLSGRDEKGFVQFKSGKYGRWGPVVSFHCYSGQDSVRHSHYDSLEGAVPIPKQLNTFNKIIGARDAVDKCAKLINFFTNVTKWEDGVKLFLEQDVFALAHNAKPANNEVDSNVGPCTAGLRTVIDARHDFEYMAGLQQKVTSLENGPCHDVEAIPGNPMWSKPNWKRSLLRSALFVLLGVLAFLAAIVCGAAMSRVVAKVLF